MNLYDSLPDAAPTVFGAEAVAELSYGVLTVDVPVGSWISSLEIARDKLGCTYFDWLSAVDEPGTGFRVCAHVASLENHRVRRLLLRTTVPHSAPSLPSAVAVYAGAEWHERETFEMFGITFTDHPHLVHLLLPENFEGHPLRKDFVLAARVAKAWPGAKEPGEAHDPDAPKRRQMLPPGVPDPNDWGPLKGQLPPAPARPARTPRAAGAAGAAARAPREGAPVRRTRSVAEGSATQATEAGTPETPETPARPPRRTRSVTEGSASQAAQAAAPEAAAPETPGTEAAARPPRRTRSVTEGSASQAAAPQAAAPETPGTEAAARPPRRTRSAADGSASQAGDGGEAAAPRRPAPRSSDAPWHDPKPAFEKPAREAAPKAEPDESSTAEPKADPGSGPAGPAAEPHAPEPKASGPDPETDPTTDPGGTA
ncbi:NADH-quinone oxidoreductase subunit C [Streptomyces sp. MMS21 TC-5]|uniref:NADH-quinone oxidoreductase subunit C n=1 Tax=Streptomyces sp. MMS21 TC-5 TaxID=2925833 RepID=UPI001F611B16|nr:NADH-quinone oxidoreductase subunit C [Streptomyces sp. MMS21 TC-5]MCI4083114.1 NADH-quinone oxidoreductase subunit C [Streptomyces sp. MMS21 TC-5]